MGRFDPLSAQGTSCTHVSDTVSSSRDQIGKYSNHSLCVSSPSSTLMRILHWTETRGSGLHCSCRLQHLVERTMCSSRAVGSAIHNATRTSSFPPHHAHLPSSPFPPTGTPQITSILTSIQIISSQYSDVARCLVTPKTGLLLERCSAHLIPSPTPPCPTLPFPKLLNSKNDSETPLKQPTRTQSIMDRCCSLIVYLKTLLVP